MMKKFCLCLFFSIPFILHGATSSQKPCLKALIVADTVTKNLHLGTTIDVIRVKKNLLALSKRLHCSAHITKMIGTGLSEKKIKSWFSRAQHNPPQILVFYYTGHGIQAKEQNNPFPLMVLPKKRDRYVSVSSKNICLNMSHVNSPLRLCIFDCCNNVQSNAEKMLKSPTVTVPLATKKKLPGLTHLFKKYPTILCAVAAAPGKTAITAIGGKNPGSFLTSAFFSALAYESQKQTPSWENVCRSTTDIISDIYKAPQRPWYFLAVKTSQANPSPIIIGVPTVS